MLNQLSMIDKINLGIWLGGAIEYTYHKEQHINDEKIILDSLCNNNLEFLDKESIYIYLYDKLLKNVKTDSNGYIDPEDYLNKLSNLIEDLKKTITKKSSYEITIYNKYNECIANARFGIINNNPEIIYTDGCNYEEHYEAVCDYGCDIYCTGEDHQEFSEKYDKFITN